MPLGSQKERGCFRLVRSDVIRRSSAEELAERNMGCGLKFTIDVGVGASLDKWLREHGYDAVSVRDIDSRAKDIECFMGESGGRA
jgi:hypothetical protein